MAGALEHVALAGRRSRPPAGHRDGAAPRPLPDFLARRYRTTPPACRSAPDPEAAPALELDCLRGYLPPSLLNAAAEHARRLGTGADHVLIRWGAITEEEYLAKLSAHSGIPLEDPEEMARSQILLPESQIPCAATHGLLPLSYAGQQRFVISPRNLTARELSRLAATSPAAARTFRLISAARLQRFLITHAGATLAHAAAEGLRERRPTMSAAPASAPAPAWRQWGRRLGGGAALAGALLLLRPSTLFDIAAGLLACWFLSFSALRLAGAITSPRENGSAPRRPDRDLPLYTIVAALYREASSVAPLLQAIDALDYPKDKLDIILVTEADDDATRAAIARCGPPPWTRVLTAPAIGPKTKPKALNWALPFARGSFITIFDAEDRPEPGQLRDALDAFQRHGDRTACVQARLSIDNPDEGWLASMFAVEYAGQFSVFLPGLARLRMPLPLGGSSNHFRADVLRQVGGWDAYNVTEDADLGFRLARFGYRTATFASTTQEEAPARFGNWLRQRSRWMKGWMQTWRVHMRAPRRLWQDIGWRGVASLNLLVGGNILTALAAPVLVLGVAAEASGVMNARHGFHVADGPMMKLHAASLLAGYASTIIIGLIGLIRCRRLDLAWVLLLTPLYWLLLSLAAWRALGQLLTNPYHWEKTEHGLSRCRGARTPPSGIAPPLQEAASMMAGEAIPARSAGRERVPPGGIQAHPPARHRDARARPTGRRERGFLDGDGMLAMRTRSAQQAESSWAQSR